MGRARVDWGDGSVEVELPRSCIMGRHPICHVLVPHDDVPAFWLEIRYTRDTWAWRTLSDEERRTTPAGEKVRDDWRALGSGEGNRVKCIGGTYVDLVDDSPPRPFAVDLASGQTCFDDALAALVAAAGAPEDHGMAAVDGRVWRFYGV